MEQKIVTSIATKKSRDLIKKYNKLQKNGVEVDWDKAFQEIEKAEAKGKKAELDAILEKKK